MTILDKIKNGEIVIFDGAMGTEIQSIEITDEEWQGCRGCNELLNVTAGDKIRAIHEAYFAAGCDVVETNTLGGTRLVLGEYELQERSYEINRAAAALAKEAALKYSESKPRYVAGSIGPGTRLASLGQISYDELYEGFYIQAEGLLDGGADIFIIETCQDLLQVKAALNAVRDLQKERGTSCPEIVSITIEQSGTMLIGSDIAAAITLLNSLKVDIMAINCATGPAEMAPYIKEMSERFRGPIMVMPNAGLPQNVDGKMKYTLEKEEFSKRLIDFIQKDGVSIVGGCCGTTPAYLALLAERVKGLSPAARSPQSAPAISSIYSSQTTRQEPAPLMIGERANTNGSKRFREFLLAGDIDGIIEVARNQQRAGAHAIDLCVAYTGRDESADMAEILPKVARQINIPLVIDSTSPQVIEEALKLYAGKPIINSINLEDGEGKAEQICALARRYGASIIALTIDEEGMAKEAGKKLEIARRLYEIAVNRYGLEPGDLIFDPLTFTLGSGDESLKSAGIETLEGIKLIKEQLPGTNTMLGLSNISFGLKASSRKILNSVYLAEALETGLDAAIVNVSHILPLYKIDEEDRKMALDLIYNRGSDKPLLTYINYFESKEGAPGDKKEEIEPQSLDDKIKKRVIDGSKSGLAELLEEKLQEIEAVEIINNLLIPAMKVVGELFGSGQMQLPFVLQSAEVMKNAVDRLKPHMKKSEQSEQKSIVLATVKGDVHDIGKNLVDIILSNNGYKVYNLGIKCEIETMLKKAQEVKADAIGMSGLLVKSTIVMKENLEYLKSMGIELPVLLGGAALTGRYVYETCDEIGDSPVVYCKDAFEGLKTMSAIKENKLEDYHKVEKERELARAAAMRGRPVQEEEPEEIDRTIEPPTPPFTGKRVLKELELDEIYPFLTEEVIFRGRWGYRRGKLSKEGYEKLIATEVRPQFEELKEFCKREKLFTPQLVYGYYHCNKVDDRVVIYHPEDGSEWKWLSFPRQKQSPHKCIADYFLPRESGRKDVIALQIVTAGPEADRYAHKLYEENRYKDYLLFHGLSVEVAEAIAEYQHKKIREELNLMEGEGSGISDFVVQKYRGSRYSFGYPACPDMEGNRVIHEILEAEEIGVELTENCQMTPEQTTSAFVVHHPQAKYFSV